MEIRNLITPEIREDLAKIDADCIRLHVPPPPVVFVRCEVSDMETGEVELVQEEKANSFNRNYYNCLIGMAMFGSVAADTTFGAGHLNVKDTAAAVTSLSNGNATTFSTALNARGNVTDATQGIAIGTGVGAESFEGHVIGTLIAHGTGAGQMSYAAGATSDSSYTAGTKKWTQTFTRVFSNTSGNTINVSEVVHYQAMQPGGAGWKYIMHDRTVLGAAVAVANNKKITVTYTYEMTFPA